MLLDVFISQCVLVDIVNLQFLDVLLIITHLYNYYSGVLGFWGFGVLGFWGFGVLGLGFRV